MKVTVYFMDNSKKEYVCEDCLVKDNMLHLYMDGHQVLHTKPGKLVNLVSSLEVDIEYEDE